MSLLVGINRSRTEVVFQHVDTKMRRYFTPDLVVDFINDDSEQTSVYIDSDCIVPIAGIVLTEMRHQVRGILRMIGGLS